MKKKLIILALHLAASGADAYYTNRNQTRPNRMGYTTRHYEADPIARPFVTHGTGLRAGYFAGTMIGEIYGAHLLRAHEHPKLADVDAAGIATHATGAAMSAKGYKKTKTK